MDFDKLRQWFEMAQKFHGSNFWSGVFDHDYAKQFMNEFAEAGAGAGSNTAQSLYPRADIAKGPNEFVVLIDIPGVRKEDVQLSVTGDFLYVKGSARPLYPELQYLSTERFSGTFERAIRLPEPVSGKITAKFEHGLLEVRIARHARPQTVIPID
jgi:HSP20 family protein